MLQLQSSKKSTLYAFVNVCVLGVFCGCRPTGGVLVVSDHVGGMMTIPVRAVVAQRDQAPVKFPSLALCGSPAHNVRRLLRQAEREYEDEHRALQAKLSRLQGQEAAAESKLDGARGAFASEYSDKAPRSDDPKYRSRNPLEGVSKARAAKSRLDEWYAEAFRERIAPLERDLEQLRGGIKAVQGELMSLRNSFSDRLFAALPASPSEVWKTDADGRTSISISRNEPWFVWAQSRRTVATTKETSGRLDAAGEFRMTQRDGGFVQSSFRWLALVPKQLDSSGELVLDQSNLFDGRVVSAALRDGDADAQALSPMGR